MNYLTMSQLCINYSLATKLIGSFGVTISTLMLNILASEFFLSQEPNTFTAAVESWTLFGLNWTYFVQNIQTYQQSYYLFACVLLYSGCSLFANLMLCFGSLTKRPNFVIPWICLQIFSIADQVFAIVIRLINTDYQFYKKSVWNVPISSCYLILSAYFLIIVCFARIEWIDFPREIPISTISRSYENTQSSNLPKSPSYLADQQFFTNSPKYLSATYREI